MQRQGTAAVTTTLARAAVLSRAAAPLRAQQQRPGVPMGTEGGLPGAQACHLEANDATTVTGAAQLVSSGLALAHVLCNTCFCTSRGHTRSVSAHIQHGPNGACASHCIPLSRYVYWGQIGKLVSVESGVCCWSLKEAANCRPWRKSWRSWGRRSREGGKDAEGQGRQGP